MAERTESGLVVRAVAQCAAWAGNRYVAWLGLVLVCLVMTSKMMRPVINPDFGWHLAMGRYIAETGSIPDHEVFTHTAAGAPMVAHEWLSQLISFLVAQNFGVLGVRWLHAALACALLSGCAGIGCRPPSLCSASSPTQSSPNRAFRFVPICTTWSSMPCSTVTSSFDARR